MIYNRRELWDYYFPNGFAAEDSSETLGNLVDHNCRRFRLINTEQLRSNNYFSLNQI